MPPPQVAICFTENVNVNGSSVDSLKEIVYNMGFDVAVVEQECDDVAGVALSGGCCEAKDCAETSFSAT